tara:strand:+ start:1111 stop:1650 length:540 start_codon:yes stop_codon:yes gene_type:complete
MASNYKVQFSVSMTPTIVNDADQSVSTTAIDAEVKKSLGGSGSVGDIDNVVMLADGTADDQVAGWAAGVPTYLNSNGSTGTGFTPSVGTRNMVFIKNTGYAWGDGTALGDKLTKTAGKWTDNEAIDVRFTNNAGAEIAKLYPGEAIVLPRCGTTTINCSTLNDTGGNISVEYAVVVDGT